jgi:hypothetical protein
MGKLHGLERNEQEAAALGAMKSTIIIAIILAASALLMPALVRTPQAIEQPQAGTEPARPH